MKFILAFGLGEIPTGLWAAVGINKVELVGLVWETVIEHVFVVVFAVNW